MNNLTINNSPSNTRYPHLNLGESDLSQCTNYLFAVDYFFTVYMREGEKTKTKIAASERMFRKKVNKSTDKEEWSMNVDEEVDFEKEASILRNHFNNAEIDLLLLIKKHVMYGAKNPTKWKFIQQSRLIRFIVFILIA
ncbi:hypothetical protein U1121_06820 [Listeria monocytogenes]